jgi:hypothetical protein
MIVRDRRKPLVERLFRRSVRLGEAGLPHAGPAIANAFATPTRDIQVQRYPFVCDCVKAALKAAA